VSVGSRPAGWAAWREILDLGQQLIARSTIAGQRDLIVRAAARLVQGQAALWLAAPLCKLPGSDPSFPLSPGTLSDLMRRALEARRPLSDAGHEPAARAVAIPVVAQDVVLGVLEVRRPDGPPFDSPEIELLDGLATQASSALYAARQVAIERWRAEQLALVCGVSAQVADILNLDVLSRRVVDLIQRTFHYYHVALFTVEPGQRLLHCRASTSSTGDRPPAGEPFPVVEVELGQGIVGTVAQTGVEILANDVARESRYRAVDALPETRSEAALPLKIEDRVLGVLDVQSDRQDGFDETDLVVLGALADQIAIAVEDAWLYDASRRRADQLSAVAEVSRAVTSILDLDALLKEVVTLIHEQFGYPFVYLFTVDAARGQIVFRAGTGDPNRAIQTDELACELDDPQGIVPWVACHGEAVLANDVSCDPRYRPVNLPPADTRSELAVPLVFGGEVLGVLDVQSDRRDAFGEDDRSLFRSLADNVAIAIRNANLYRSERWRRQVAEGMREVAGLLSADVGVDKVLEAILAELERALPCDVVAIWLLRDGVLRLAAVHGCGEDVCTAGCLSPDVVGPWLIQALDGDRPVIRTPQSPPEPLGSVLGFPPDHSAIAAPLRAGAQRLGVLALTHRSAGRYGAESRMITTAFASYAAVAIENARLYQTAQEQAWISTAMLQVAEATQSLTSLDQVLETVVRLAPMLAGVDRCALLLWDESAEAFVPAAAYGLTSAQQTAFDRWFILPGSVPAFDSLRHEKEAIFIDDADTDPRLMGSGIRDLGPGPLLLLPLLAHGETVGAMLAVNHRFDDQNGSSGSGVTDAVRNGRLAIVRGIAHQTAAAVESVRLLQAQQEDAYVSAALLQVAQAVASSSELDDVLGTIVRIVPMLVGVARCIMFLWDDGTSVFRPVQTYGVPQDARATLLARRYVPGDFALLDAVRERGRLIVYPDDISSDGLGGEGQAVPPGIVANLLGKPHGELPSLLAVPLEMKGQVLGAMVLEEAGTMSGSRDRRLEIITGIAHQAALAVQGDRFQREMAERERLERELQLAHEIQMTFMPSQPPDLAGWELAFAWRAARQVAGDFYDFFKLAGGRLGLVIADVADKGMPAALFMALTRTLMRAAALEETSPAAALARVNDLLVPDAQHGMFVTVFYAVLSLATGELTYANAGHNLPLLLRSSRQKLAWLEKGGMALGVMEGIQFGERSISLGPDDCVVFYTDGITEALSPEGHMYGEGRLQAAVQSAECSSAQAMLDGIDLSLAAFVGSGVPSDDRTLMVLHRVQTK